ncbi:MAG: chorismate lyase [Pseudomonadota bacterium]
MLEKIRFGLAFPRWSGKAALLSARIPRGLRGWLFDESSLTKRLRRRCPQSFRVRVMSQRRERPLPDEAACLGMRAGEHGLVRQVCLQCGLQPLVYARTVIPFPTLRGPVKRLAHLGSRPLGEVLFADKSMRRGPVQVARLLAAHAVYREAAAAGAGAPEELWGRRSLFYLGGKPLLVSEIFLPALEERESGQGS